MIHVKKLEEAGYQSALFGLSLNKNKKPEDMAKVLERLASMDGGHNKALEHIDIWLEVRAPRYWWQEADTYRLSTKNSESTMHTIDKRNLESSDFENGDINSATLHDLNWKLNKLRKKEITMSEFKRHLPEGFMQTRMWKMSYKTLRNIIMQRRKHRLENWRDFIQQTLDQVDHPELLPKS